MATVSVNIIQLEGTPHPDQPHAQDEWFRSLPRPGPNASRSIQRFPQELRRNDEDKECYEPLAISIGPYHRQKEHLEPIQNLKASFASKYIESKGSTFGHLYGKVERVAAEARKCYAEDATLEMMSDLDFTRMMFLDGCFILQFISGELDDLGKKSSLMVQDLLLLENQLPFIVLMELEGQEEYDKLIEKLKTFFRIAVWYTPKPETHSSWWSKRIHDLLPFLRQRAQPDQTHSSPTPQPIHLLHFLRAYLLGNQNHNMVRAQPETTHSPWWVKPIHCLLHFLRQCAHPWVKQNDNMCTPQPETHSSRRPSPQPNLNKNNESSDDELWNTFRSVKELNRAGIDVRVGRSHSFSNVRFRSRRMWRGELELPPIFIYGGTKSILLNLVAYEMCYQDMFMEIPNVTSYISFLDHLIDRPEDVMELRSKGILKNFTASDQEVADLFNTITRNFTLNPEAYKDVNRQIEDHRKSSIKMWFLNWIDTYFEAPWSVTSFVAAAIALALTFMQTYLAFREPGNSQN